MKTFKYRSSKITGVLHIIANTYDDASVLLLNHKIFNYDDWNLYDIKDNMVNSSQCADNKSNVCFIKLIQ